jgi:hypothetical protein
MQWFLHVGITKTGSKAIQHYLDAEAARMPRSLCFPASGRHGVRHEPLAQQLQRGGSDLLQVARNEAERSGAERAILSCETLFQLPGPAIASLRDVIGPAAVVLYLRRQDQHADSWYNQLIKAHRIPFSFIVEHEKALTAYDPRLDYAATIRKWQQVFGEDAVHPVLYDKNRSSVPPLLRLMGLDVPEEAQVGRPNPNPALSPDLASTLRGIKELVGDPETLVEVVRSFHRAHWAEFTDTATSENACLLDAATRRSILGRYEASNEVVRERFFPKRASLFDGHFSADHVALDLDAGRARARKFLEEAFPGLVAGH